MRLLLDNEGLDDALRQAFVVYLASHDRPMAELLAPRAKPLRDSFEREFAVLAREPLSVEVLEATQATLPVLLRSSLSLNERQFLVSIKRGEPDWSLLPIPNLAELPALRWKLANIETLKQSPARHQSAVDALRTVLEI